MLNVLKKTDLQLDIIEVTTSLARETKKEASVAIVGAISDVISFKCHVIFVFVFEQRFANTGLI